MSSERLAKIDHVIERGITAGGYSRARPSSSDGAARP